MATKAKTISADVEEELGVTTATKDELLNLSKQVSKAVDLQTTIESIEEMLKGHKEELHNLTTRIIPDTMRAAKTSLHKTDAGVKVELKAFLNGSLPKEPEARAKAMTWLEKNGAKDLIKTFFNVGLGRGQKAQAAAVEKALGKLGVTFTAKEDVHAQSLYAFVRERMRAAQECPLEMLGIYAGTVAKIELPEKR